jgi:hypothetical protein
MVYYLLTGLPGSLKKLTEGSKANRQTLKFEIMKKYIDYIPRPDSAFDSFQSVFVAAATAGAGGWGIPPGDLTTLASYQTAWDAAWLVAKNYSNRTRTNVLVKKLARKSYETALRQFIQQWIYDNPLLNDADRESTGVKPYDRIRTSIPVPVIAPTMDFQLLAGNTIRVKLRNPSLEEGADLKGKPAGVRSIQVVWDYETPESGPDSCRFRISTTRSVRLLHFSYADRGRNVVIFARYLNTKDEPGPWSDIRFTTVP